MASPAPESPRRLLDRYLDPRRPWTGVHARRLRSMLEADAAGRRLYDRVVVRHRLLVGAEPGLPSGFERRRRMEALLECVDAGAAGSRREVTGSVWTQGWWLAALGWAAAVFCVALLVPSLLPPPEDSLRARGGASLVRPAARTGIGLTGVTEGGEEYEVVASEGVRLVDYLRISYSYEPPATSDRGLEPAGRGHLFVFGLQAGRPVSWYTPTPEEGRSLAISAGRAVALPYEIRLGVRHVAGPLRVVAIFSFRPLSLAEVARALDKGGADLGRSDLISLLRSRLSLSERDTVRIVRTRVLPGPPRPGGSSR